MKKEMLLQFRNRSGSFIFFIAICFFIQGVAGASLNDACFAGECHNTTGQVINHTLYDSNPHKIINCIDCHVNSTDDSSPEHGQFIRQFNGSNITGPLTTKYYPENFSLCYACHNENKVIGVLDNYNVSNYHRTPKTIVPFIGTNFINILPYGYYNGNNDYPTNIHWNHLDDFGSYQPLGYFDSNKDRDEDSYHSCPACHDVHGTDYPKMTKNGIAITYSSDGNGTFGYIGSNEYKNPASNQFICGAYCHTSGPTFRYYRNEINIFEDCVFCHIDNTDNVPGISLLNRSAFSQGVHVNINTSGGDDTVNNKDCWTCHFNKDMERANISRCEDCHVTGKALPEPAPLIRTHISGAAITNYSCSDCHSKAIVDPGTGITNVTSHYLQRPVINTVNYCDYCHGPDAKAPFPATNKIISKFEHDDNNWNGIATCRTCHSNSSVIADLYATDISSFHDMTTELGDVNGTTKANCILCHIQKDAQFVQAPATPEYHPDTNSMPLAECYECHGNDRHNVLGGSCISCHTIPGTRYSVNTNIYGRHKNVNRTDDPLNVTDDDCKTCHFGSANYSMPMKLGAANESNTYFCPDCHTATGRNPSQFATITDETLRKMPMPPGHGENNCMQCHIPGYNKPRPLTDKVRYHTHGPLGFVE